MTAHLAEHMRNLKTILENIHHPELPGAGLKGTLNPKQLAELLGVSDLQTFTRSMNKIRMGDADKLTRLEITELAEAFVRLLAAEPEDTQKAMLALKRVSAKVEPVMEAWAPKEQGNIDTQLSKLVKSVKKYPDVKVKKGVKTHTVGIPSLGIKFKFTVYKDDGELWINWQEDYSGQSGNDPLKSLKDVFAEMMELATKK